MNDLTASVESRGVRIESTSLISSVDTTFRKAKVEKPHWIICYRFALGAILVWEVNTRLTNGIQSFQSQSVHGFATCLKNSSDLNITVTKPKNKFRERTDTIADKYITFRKG